jgi:hypothetical protein
MQSLGAKWQDLVDGTNDNIIISICNIFGNMNQNQLEVKHYAKEFFHHLNKPFIPHQHCEIKFSLHMKSCHWFWFESKRKGGKMNTKKCVLS